MQTITWPSFAHYSTTPWICQRYLLRKQFSGTDHYDNCSKTYRGTLRNRHLWISSGLINRLWKQTKYLLLEILKPELHVQRKIQNSELNAHSQKYWTQNYMFTQSSLKLTCSVYSPIIKIKLYTRDLRCSAILGSAQWQFCTDVLGQTIGPIFKGQDYKIVDKNQIQQEWETGIAINVY
jgi:hypothetical protein